MSTSLTWRLPLSDGKMIVLVASHIESLQETGEEDKTRITMTSGAAYVVKISPAQIERDFLNY